MKDRNRVIILKDNYVVTRYALSLSINRDARYTISRGGKLIKGCLTFGGVLHQLKLLRE